MDWIFSFEGHFSQNLSNDMLSSRADTEYRLVVAEEERKWGRDRLGGWGWQMQIIIYRMDNNSSYCVAQGTIINIL